MKPMIWKKVIPWPLPDDFIVVLEIPKDARFLAYNTLPEPRDNRGGEPSLPTLWFLFDQGAPLELVERHYLAVGTGRPFPACEPGDGYAYVGSAPARVDDFNVHMVHLFEVVPAAWADEDLDEVEAAEESEEIVTLPSPVVTDNSFTGPYTSHVLLQLTRERVADAVTKALAIQRRHGAEIHFSESDFVTDLCAELRVK